MKHKTNDYIWLQLSKVFFGTENDIYLCYIYNPPAESSYTKNIEIDYLEILERDITHYSGHGEVIIGGDLNARIGNLKRLYYTLFRGSYTPLL